VLQAEAPKKDFITAKRNFIFFDQERNFWRSAKTKISNQIHALAKEAPTI
jgi:hypothetical protein